MVVSYRAYSYYTTIILLIIALLPAASTSYYYATIITTIVSTIIIDTTSLSVLLLVLLLSFWGLGSRGFRVECISAGRIYGFEFFWYKFYMAAWHSRVALRGLKDAHFGFRGFRGLATASFALCN